MMTMIKVTVALAALWMLAACATTPPADSDQPAAGIRREPCGGGPVFPPEEPTPGPDNGDALAIEE